MKKPSLWKRIAKINFLLFFIMLSQLALCQVSISGPICVIPGTNYQYIIKAPWDSVKIMSICVTGGKLESGGYCTPSGAIKSSIIVFWNDNGNKKIEVTSSVGNAVLPVSGTTELSGGQITDSMKVQVYNPNKLIYTFQCSEASGGSCNPIYYYQWQVSDNGLYWKNIPGANGKDLQFSDKIMGNTYFRRVTSETSSNMMVYSDLAQLTVVF